jgi:hypothetical protein
MVLPQLAASVQVLMPAGASRGVQLPQQGMLPPSNLHALGQHRATCAASALQKKWRATAIGAAATKADRTPTADIMGSASS